MAHSFHRTAQSIRKDNGLKSGISLVTAVCLLAGWVAWACRAHVSRYEVSESARLEVNASAYPVQSSLSGRLSFSTLVLGREVREGEVLAELSADAEKLTLEEERARYASFQPQLAALRAQMASEQAGMEADRSVSKYSDLTASAQYRQADAEAVLAEQQAERARRMRAEGILAPAEADKATADAESKRAAADSLKAAASRLQPELRVKNGERDVRLRQIAAQKAKLEADLTVSGAAIKRLQYEIERRQIRAPVSGRLAECAILPPGSHIGEGQQLGIILPSSEVRVVAQFLPAAAFGKLHEGQPATLRLDGFPWAQFGVVKARVSRVASEIRDGKVRVELAVDRVPHPRIPIQHGLPGSVEIEIEHTTPATLLLRSAGTLVGGH